MTFIFFCGLAAAVSCIFFLFNISGKSAFVKIIFIILMLANLLSSIGLFANSPEVKSKYEYIIGE